MFGVVTMMIVIKQYFKLLRSFVFLLYCIQLYQIQKSVCY